MYEDFFKLKYKPFTLLPDPEFLFLSKKHAIALSLLEYSLSGQAGFCVITGEIGSGKTTLVRAFLGRVNRDFSVGLISNTHQALRDIAAWVLTAFGQKPSGTNQAETYQELMAYLIAEYGAGRQCVLIVDEAQNLSIEALEELRLLSNINTGKDLLLQMVLVGQPELLEKLQRPELKQFAQRIAVSHHLTPLPFSDSRQYIEHRLKVAGREDELFTEMAMGAVQYFSGGVPRLINSICDMALVYAFADGVNKIDEELVFRVVSDRQGSGIAPFAQLASVDDPAVRAEITDLARSGGARPEGTGAQEAAATPAPPASATAPVAAPQASTAPAPALVASPAPALAPAPIPVATSAPAAVAAAPAPSPAPDLSPAPAAAASAPAAARAAVSDSMPTAASVPDRTAIAAAVASAHPPASTNGATAERILEAAKNPPASRTAPAGAAKVAGKSDLYFRGSEADDELILTVEAAGAPAKSAQPAEPEPSTPGVGAELRAFLRTKEVPAEWHRDSRKTPKAAGPERGAGVAAVAAEQSRAAAPARRSWWWRRSQSGRD